MKEDFVKEERVRIDKFLKLLSDSYDKELERSKCPRSVAFNSDVVNCHNCIYFSYPNSSRMFELVEFYVPSWVNLFKAVEDAVEYLDEHYGYGHRMMFVPLALYSKYIEGYDVTNLYRVMSLDEWCEQLGVRFVVMTPDACKDMVKPIDPTELYKQRKESL